MRTPRQLLIPACFLALLALAACSTGGLPPTASPAGTLLASAPPIITPTYQPYPYPIPTQPEPYNPYPYPWTYSVPSITPGPSPTLSPSVPLPPTPVPGLSPTPYIPLNVAELTKTDLQAMVFGQEVFFTEQTVLYQISQAPLGVRSLEWAPGGRQIVLDVISGNSDPLHVTFTFPFIVDTDVWTAWSTYVEDTSYCLEHSDWSPDGQYLAYLDNRQLWIADARDGTGQMQSLPPSVEGLHTLRYSPDGSQIALLSEKVQSDRMVYDLWLRPSAGGRESLLVEDAGYGMPVWSQDGLKVALLNETGQLWMVDLAGGATTQADLSPVPGSEVCLSPPEWVAESSKVLAAIRHTANVWLVDLDGNTELLLPRDSSSAQRPPGLAAPLRGGPSAWASASPDGNYAVYGSSASNDRHLIEFSTGKITRLEAAIVMGKIVWSPNQPQFVSSGWNSPFLLVNATDGSVTELEPNSLFPSWSPDGRFIAFWKIERFPQLDGFTLYIYDTRDGQSQRLLGPDPENPSGGGSWGYDLIPRWSPDGRSIAFVSNRSGDPQAYLLRLSSNILQ